MNEQAQAAALQPGLHTGLVDTDTWRRPGCDPAAPAVPQSAIFSRPNWYVT